MRNVTLLAAILCLSLVACVGKDPIDMIDEKANYVFDKDSDTTVVYGSREPLSSDDIPEVEAALADDDPSEGDISEEESNVAESRSWPEKDIEFANLYHRFAEIIGGDLYYTKDQIQEGEEFMSRNGRNILIYDLNFDGSPELVLVSRTENIVEVLFYEYSEEINEFPCKYTIVLEDKVGSNFDILASSEKCVFYFYQVSDDGDTNYEFYFPLDELNYEIHEYELAMIQIDGFISFQGKNEDIDKQTFTSLKSIYDDYQLLLSSEKGTDFVLSFNRQEALYWLEHF